MILDSLKNWQIDWISGQKKKKDVGSGILILLSLRVDGLWVDNSENGKDEQGSNISQDSVHFVLIPLGKGKNSSCFSYG